MSNRWEGGGRETEGDSAVVQAKGEKCIGPGWEEDAASGMEVTPRGLAEGLGVGMRREGSTRAMVPFPRWAKQGRRGCAVGKSILCQGHVAFETQQQARVSLG